MKTNQTKILSVLLALILALSSIAVMPLSAAAAEVEAPAQTGDSPYSGLTLDSGKLYFDAASAGWSYDTINKVAFYILDDQGSEILQYGNRKAIGTATAGADGIFEFDVAAKTGVTLTPGVQYQIWFFATNRFSWGAHTCSVYFTTDCLGHVAYATGKSFDYTLNGIDFGGAEAYFDGIDPTVCGPVMMIDDNYDAFGECPPAGKTAYDLLVDFISVKDQNGSTRLEYARIRAIEFGEKTEQELIDNIAYGLGLSKEDVSRAFSENGVSTSWSPDATSENDFTYSTPDSSSATITGYTGNRIIVEIPEEIDGYTVTGIDEHAFSFQETIRKIQIPDTVTEIGIGAFYNCYALQEINLPEQLKEINRDTFNACISLSKINLPDSLTYISSCAFLDCSSLTSIDIPDSIRTIPYATFAGCSSLKEIKLPDHITSLGREAFDGCRALQSINIPSSVTFIGDLAFNGCTSLSEINIPDSVTEIGWWAFKGCTSLVKVTIPDSVVSIGDDAFDASCPLTIYGYYGTEAERYAARYGFVFRMIAPATSDEVSLDAPEGYTYSVVKKATNDEATPDEAAPVDEQQLPKGSVVLSVYDITLRNAEDETPVQPESPVTIRIRCDDPNAHVYRRETDGSLTDMNARYEDGYLIFETDHFSLYIVATGAEVDLAICGDADGDGDITSLDVTVLQRRIAKTYTGIPDEILMRGDADGNGELEIIDVTILQRHLAKMDTGYPVGEPL